jgi:hypothetical protein
MMILLGLMMLVSGMDDDVTNYNTARLDRKVTIVQITEKIEIDGRLGEPAWSNAPLATDFVQNEPRPGEPASEQTEVRILYDNEHLFGLYARKPDERNHYRRA